MCAYSVVVHDWQNKQSPNYIPWTQSWPTPPVAQEMLEIMKRLDELDKKLGAIDCRLTEKEKVKFELKVKRRAKQK